MIIGEIVAITGGATSAVGDALVYGGLAVGRAGMLIATTTAGMFAATAAGMRIREATERIVFQVAAAELVSGVVGVGLGG